METTGSVVDVKDRELDLAHNSRSLIFVLHNRWCHF